MGTVPVAIVAIFATTAADSWWFAKPRRAVAADWLVKADFDLASASFS